MGPDPKWFAFPKCSLATHIVMAPRCICVFARLHVNDLMLVQICCVDGVKHYLGQQKQTVCPFWFKGAPGTIRGDPSTIWAPACHHLGSVGSPWSSHRHHLHFVGRPLGPSWTLYRNCEKLYRGSWHPFCSTHPNSAGAPLPLTKFLFLFFVLFCYFLSPLGTILHPSETPS